MGMSSFDRAHIDDIIADKDGRQYDWFNAYIIRFLDLIWGKADSNNRAILRQAWPDTVEAYENWTMMSRVQDEWK